MSQEKNGETNTYRLKPLEYHGRGGDRLMRKRWKQFAVRLFASVLMFLLCFYFGRINREVLKRMDFEIPAYILDAGHGGEDGGAVSVTGTKESTINMEIVRRMDQLLGLMGDSPLLLREEDVSLHDSSSVTLREKKVSDLKNRAATVNANPSATLVSIHQNSYPELKYHGAQTFFAPTAGSEELASALQTQLKYYLQPENNRSEKQIPESIYLLNHVQNRSVLIECGFLSNPEEEQLLQQNHYQTKLAMVITSVLIE